MQYAADVVHPRTKSAGAVQWAHSSLSRIPLVIRTAELIRGVSVFDTDSQSTTNEQPLTDILVPMIYQLNGWMLILTTIGPVVCIFIVLGLSIRWIVRRTTVATDAHTTETGKLLARFTSLEMVVKEKRETEMAGLRFIQEPKARARCSGLIAVCPEYRVHSETYMHTTPNSYTDIDYESFPIADLDLDRHWVQLPNSVLAERRQARQQAVERERSLDMPGTNWAANWAAGK